MGASWFKFLFIATEETMTIIFHLEHAKKRDEAEFPAPERKALVSEIPNLLKNSSDTKRSTKSNTSSILFRFAIRVANSQIIGVSPNYKSKRNRNNGIISVMENVPKVDK